MKGRGSDSTGPGNNNSIRDGTVKGLGIATPVCEPGYDLALNFCSPPAFSAPDNIGPHQMSCRRCLHSA